MSNVKSDYTRHHRMERLCRRAETGWGEDGPVVNLRNDGVMVCVEYCNYWSMSIPAAEAARRAIAGSNDPLPNHFGSVVEAAKEKNNPGLRTDIFPTSAAHEYARARQQKQASVTGFYSMPADLRAASNGRLYAIRSQLSGQYAYVSGAEQSEIVSKIDLLDAEIKRRYLSTPVVMVI